MSKATLEFSLPEERVEYELAAKGGNWAGVVWDMDQWLRKQLKYGHEFKDACEALAAARDELHDIMEAKSVGMDDFE